MFNPLRRAASTSSSSSAPAVPVGGAMDDHTATAAYFRYGISPEDLTAEMEGKPDGYFVIRDSASQPGNYALAYRAAGQTKHLHIVARQGGIGLSKSDRTFETLIEFVGFYSHSNADLACPLVVDPKTQKRIERDAKTKNKTLERQKRTSSKSGKTKKDALGSQFSVADIVTFLTTKNMGAYAPIFKKNKVDGVKFLSMEEDDLKSLGVGLPDARQVLLDCIRQLRSKLSAEQEGGVGGSTPTSPSASSFVPPQPAAPGQVLHQAANPMMMQQPMSPPPGGGMLPPGGHPPQQQQQQTTIGLVARRINGEVRIFDQETGEEVFDVQAHQARMREKLAKQQAINAIIANQAATAAQEYNEDFYGGADSIVPIPPPAPLVQEDDLYNAPTQPQFVRTASARVSANPAPLPPRGAGPPTGNPVPLPPRGATGQPASTPSNRLPAPVPGGGAGRPPAPPPGSSNVPLPPRGGATMPVAVEQESYEQVDDFGFGLPPPSSLAAGGRQPAPLPGGGQSRAPAPLPPPPIGDDSFGFGAPVVMEQDAYNSLPPPRSDANVPVAQNMPQYTNVDEEQDTIGFGVVETSGALYTNMSAGGGFDAAAPASPSVSGQRPPAPIPGRAQAPPPGMRDSFSGRPPAALPGSAGGLGGGSSFNGGRPPASVPAGAGAAAGGDFGRQSSWADSSVRSTMSDQSQLSAAVGSDAGRQRTRTISTFVDYAARSASWYTTDTSAPESLTSQPAGSFLVVDTSAQRGGDALPPAVHYVITDGVVGVIPFAAEADGLRLAECREVLPNLTALIWHYGSDNEELPFLFRIPDSLQSLSLNGNDMDYVTHQWYVHGMSKEEAQALVEFEPEGSFVLRKSESHPGCFALLYMHSGVALQQLVEETVSGWRIRQSASNFHNTLLELVQFYMQDGEELGCVLVPPRPLHTIKLYRQHKLAQRQQTDSMSIDAMAQARMQSWQANGMAGPRMEWDMRHASREDALLTLNGKPPGTFVLRSSLETFAALSLVVTDGSMQHLHIEQSGAGVYLRKCKQTFPDLYALVQHYTSPTQTDLQVPLRL